MDRKSVKLTPALTITAQVQMGVAFGFVGILLAFPFTVTGMILIRMLYIEDPLGGRGTPKGDEAEPGKPDSGQPADMDYA